MRRRDKVGLDDFVTFIVDNPPNGDSWSGADEWEHNLTRAVPGWREIVAEAYRDPPAWARLEAARPKRSYDALCDLLVATIGSDLARRWFRSTAKDQADSVLTHGRYRLREGWCIDNVHLWAEFDADMKNEVLRHVFEWKPGEPYESFRKLPRFERSHRRQLPSNFFFLCPYVPSTLVELLRNITRDVGDERYPARIDEMISRRKEACSRRAASMQTAVPHTYTPNEDARELIARLLEITRRSGYAPAALPSILVSFDTPPIFVSHPELEDEGNDNRIDDGRHADERRIPRNRERTRPETISIEELLGVYQPRHERIVLYERGIRWAANRRNHRRLDERWLRAVVLQTRALSRPSDEVFQLSSNSLTASSSSRHYVRR